MRSFFSDLLFEVNPISNPQPLYAEGGSLYHQISDALHQSLYRVISLLIAILPGILALIAALAVCTGLGILFSFLLRRGLTAAKFDDRVTRGSGNNEWTPTRSPTEILSRTVFWGFVLLGLIIGVSAFDTSFASASAISISLLPYLTHAVGAIFLLIAGTLIARFLSRTVLIGAVNAQLQYARFLSLGVKWLVLVLTAAMVLDHLEVGGTVVELAFGILFGGIVLTLALAVGLGSRDLVSRSLESHVDRSDHTGSVAGSSTPPPESIRHF